MSRDKEQRYAFGPFRIDLEERELLCAETRVVLTPKAFDLLAYLVMNPGRALDKAELLAKLWPDVAVEENNLAVHVTALRKSLGEGKSTHVYIETLPRRGYRFAAPVRALSSRLPQPALPAQTTPFIGREAELARLTSLLEDPQQRLITLVAPGGMGKSRLALEAGRVFSSGGGALPQRVVWVELAPLGSATLLASAIAQAAGLASWSGGALHEQLSQAWRGSSVLLVLDNFEHVLAGASLVTQLLEQVVALKVLITSREALSLHAETQLSLSGLGAPEEDDPSQPLEFSGVRLFAQGAARLGVDVVSRPEDVRAAVRICRLLQGMPLGIVLAASWVHVLSVAEIESEMARSLDFLRADLLDIPERQRSLRAVFDQTWQLLRPEERATFSALSVFRGGFTRAAAEAVTGAALGVLARLANKSLVRLEPRTGRYQIHELLRQDAARRREQSAEPVTAPDRHADYYARYLEQREADLRGSEPGRALAEIDAEIGNVRAAFRWMLERQQTPSVSRCIEALNLFYERRAAYSEAATVFAHAANGLHASTHSTTHETAKIVRVALRSHTAHLREEGASSSD